jgi:hypothetical protein
MESSYSICKRIKKTPWAQDIAQGYESNSLIINSVSKYIPQQKRIS